MSERRNGPGANEERFRGSAPSPADINSTDRHPVPGEQEDGPKLRDYADEGTPDSAESQPGTAEASAEVDPVAALEAAIEEQEAAAVAAGEARARLYDIDEEADPAAHAAAQEEYRRASDARWAAVQAGIEAAAAFQQSQSTTDGESSPAEPAPQPTGGQRRRPSPRPRGGQGGSQPTPSRAGGQRRPSPRPRPSSASNPQPTPTPTPTPQPSPGSRPTPRPRPASTPQASPNAGPQPTPNAQPGANPNQNPNTTPNAGPTDPENEGDNPEEDNRFENTPLTAAREKLAEASVDARRGKLTFNRKKRSNALKEAQEAYHTERRRFMEGKLAALGAGAPEEDMDELLKELSATEDGRLMGEEANYYLTKENSKWQTQVVERFNSYSRGKRIVIGLGASAAVAVVMIPTGIAATVGGAVAGGAMAAFRFGKGYMNNEANRQGQAARTLEEKQQMATLRNLNEAYSDQMGQELTGVGTTIPEGVSENNTRAIKRNRRLNIAGGKARMGAVDSAYEGALNTAEQEKKDKRKSAYLAVGGAAVGAGLAAVIGAIVDGVGNGGGGARPEAASASPDVDSDAETDTKTETDTDTSAEFSAEPYEIRKGQGFYELFEDKGIPQSEWESLLDKVGPDLVEQDLAYYDAQAGEYRMYMTESGTVSTESLETIYDAWQGEGVLEDIDTVPDTVPDATEPIEPQGEGAGASDAEADGGGSDGETPANNDNNTTDAGQANGGDGGTPAESEYLSPGEILEAQGVYVGESSFSVDASTDLNLMDLKLELNEYFGVNLSTANYVTVLNEYTGADLTAGRELSGTYSVSGESSGVSLRDYVRTRASQLR